MAERKEQIEDQLRMLGAEFVERESDRTSLITVTRAELSKNEREAIIFVTVFPDDKEETALAFLKRHRSDLRSFLKQRRKWRKLPQTDFAIDHGEKNRQRLDELSREDR